MNFISNILAPTDCSDESINVLNYAIKTAKKNQAKLMILYVVSSLRRSVSNIFSMNGESVQITAKNKICELWESLDENEIEADLVVQCGDPFTEIMSCARSQKNDVIVMGTNGRTGLTHAVMGSVAEKVVRYSPIPVIIVKNELFVIRKLLQNSTYEYDMHKIYGLI